MFFIINKEEYVEKLFISIPPEFRKYVARVLFPIIVVLGIIQIEGVIIFLAKDASFIGLVAIFIGVTLYRGWYVHTWATLERWLLVHDRAFLLRFKIWKFKIGRGVYHILKWTHHLTNCRNLSVWRVAVECVLGFFFGLTGVGLKFGIGMIVVSRRPQLLKAAVNMGLMVNTYIFLRWGPQCWQLFKAWVCDLFRGLFS